MEYRFSRHAQTEMERRKISVDLVESVLDNPQQVISEKEGRKAYQSKIDIGGRAFLLRVIVVDDVEPAVVITVYKTSKIDKYWRAE
jgi:mRNA-degrading endonuclease RelE of RelBE toxin-antitoxin system